MTTYRPEDFGMQQHGPQFAVLDARLTAHGFPPTRLMHNLRDRVQAWQLAQGWKGTGADGLVGPRTLARLLADPPPRFSIDLRPWKLTTAEDAGGRAREILNPELATYSGEWLRRNPDGSIELRAPIDGATTPGSNYCRDEFREMDGTAKAAWSSAEGVHRLTGRFAILETPVVKPEIVIGQIHDNVDDVVMLLARAIDDQLIQMYLSESLGPGSSIRRRLAVVRFGEPFDWLIEATPDGIHLEANGAGLDVDRVIEDEVAYFKAGVYVNSNLSKGDKPGAGGGVRIEDLDVLHAA